jgi:hypothetical protein
LHFLNWFSDCKLVFIIPFDHHNYRCIIIIFYLLGSASSCINQQLCGMMFGVGAGAAATAYIVTLGSFAPLAVSMIFASVCFFVRQFFRSLSGFASQPTTTVASSIICAICLCLFFTLILWHFCSLWCSNRCWNIKKYQNIVIKFLLTIINFR